MEVVKTAGGIVRRDIEREESLKNAPARGAPNNYLAEMKRPVEPTSTTLLSMPPTVLGFFQSVTGFPLYGAVNHVESRSEALLTKVWEPGWRAEFQSSTDDDARVEGSREATGEAVRERRAASAGGTGREEVGGGSGDGSARPACEKQAKVMDGIQRDNRSFRRQLVVSCTSLVKAVLGDRYMASHHIKATQWAKSKGTPRAVLNFCAEHGLCVTDSQLYHRESKLAKTVDDANLMPKCATCCAFAQDNCDHEPSIGVRQGEGPHIATVASTAHWLGEEVGALEDASMLKRLGDLSTDDVLLGPDPAEGERRYGDFFRTLLGAVSTSEQIRSTEGAQQWCFEAQLREVRLYFFVFSFRRVVPAV